MAISFVQEVVKDGSSGAVGSLVGTLGAGVTTTVGNTLILRFFANLGVTSVTDSKGNTWTVDATQSPSYFYGLAHTTLTTALVAGDTITVTLTGSTSYHTFVVDEWSGISGYGNRSAASGTTSTARATNAVSVWAGALVIGLWAVPVSDTATFAADTAGGWTAFHTPAQLTTNSSDTIEGEYRIDPGTASSYNPDGTGVSASWSGFAAYYTATGSKAPVRGFLELL